MRMKAALPPARRPVSLLTGGFDKPYAYGITRALAAQGLEVEVIGSNDIDSPEMHNTPGVTFLNFLDRWRHDAAEPAKLSYVLLYYIRLILYSLQTRSKVFHILWNYKFATFDRTALLLYFKALKKRIVFTAHNVNAGTRDGTDSWFNRWTLRAQYCLVDHIFVHTPKMRDELCKEYSIAPEKVTVIPFGINNALPQTTLTSSEARDRLQLSNSDRVLLFFGNIRPYKGLEHLVEAVGQLRKVDHVKYCLLIAGEVNKHSREYWTDIQAKIQEVNAENGIRILPRAEYIPDAEAETYFKAADALVLPYTHVYQSGVLVLAYSFGLPVIATDSGSLSDDILPGRTGLLCKQRNPRELALTIENYFAGSLYRSLSDARIAIRGFAKMKYSWSTVARMTLQVYNALDSSQNR